MREASVTSERGDGDWVLSVIERSVVKLNESVGSGDAEADIVA